MHWLHHTHIGVANEDFTVQARPIQIHSGVFFNMDCTMEEGYQVARNQCMDFSDFFLLVCDDWLYWDIDVLSFVWDCYMISMIHNIWYLGFLASGFPIKQLCYVRLFLLLHVFAITFKFLQNINKRRILYLARR